ncbi:MAG: AAA family ATPase [Acidaminococcaceae bacterium]|nr:AAA family ATPase [Acidaminococcaceae bacterium]
MLKLIIRNIGKLKDAAIEINGITVIAGENDTGKSTVGRCLFAICNSFYDFDNKIENERKKSVAAILSRISLHLRHEKRVFLNINEEELADIIVTRLSNTLSEKQDLQESIINEIRQYDQNIIISIDNEELQSICSNIQATLLVSDFELLSLIIEKKLDAEFNSQICNIFNNEDAGEIQVKLKNVFFRTVIRNDRLSEMSSESILPIKGDVLYFDDPFLLEDYKKFLFPFFYGLFDHQSYMRQKLNMIRNDGSIINEIIAKKKLKSIYDKISLACKGDILFDSNQRLVYKLKGSDKTLNVHNLSTGLKTFGLVKKLLENGTLEKDGILILDEPEIHLHPKWQLLLAEIIVLLQKEFGLYVLVNTHSPYFLHAIEVYAELEGIVDVCKYYFAYNEKNSSYIKDVTGNVEVIYKTLAAPLQVLENERYED